MLDLAVVNRQETFERMRDPLAARNVRIHHVPVAERTVSIDDPPWSSDDYDVGFVFPGRVMAGGVADALLAVPWLNDRERVLRSRNKAEVLARLHLAGIDVPKTVYVSNPVDEAALRSAFDRFDPPVVVKPNSTTRGTGVVKVSDVDSFLGVGDYLSLVHDFQATADKSYLVQEYVPDAVDVRAMVIDGTYVGAVERRLPKRERERGRWKHNVHRGATASQYDLPSALRSLVESVAETLDIPFLGVDLLVSDDRTVVVETNARPTIDDEGKYERDFYDRLTAAIRRVADSTVE